MVAWTVRCGTCRRKKIKCDRQWPACGQCRKSRQPCPGAPERLKFVPENTTKIPGTSLARTPATVIRYPVILNEQPQISRSIRGTHAMEVGSELMALLTSQVETFGFSSFAHLLTNVPAMLESSEALTGAIACLSDARKRQLASPKPERKLDLKLYGSALHNLRKDLQDTGKLNRMETLLATLVMCRVEATIATTADLPHLIVTWSVHLTGVGYLLERLGPEALRDKLVFSVLLEIVCELSSHYYARDESFFLASPQWQRALMEIRDPPLVDRLLLAVFAQMAEFPDVMRELRRYHTGQVPFQYVHSRTKVMWEAFKAIEGPMQDIIEDRSLISKRPASSPSSPVEEVYEAGKDVVARVCCLHAVGCIVAHNMFLAVDQDSSREIEQGKRALSRRIWMFHEQAMKVGSFGMHYYPTALLLTYDSADSEDTRDWIVDQLNLLQGRNPATDNMWTSEEVYRRCQATSGSI
ncbi:hypothetical protein GGS26DRAFT_571822 [Hypomontagnella submonticulosa]|nr:hypothetical protein GGS26DRAFT_571822 [Hypomontagnella submonticulosa]